MNGLRHSGRAPVLIASQSKRVVSGRPPGAFGERAEGEVNLWLERRLFVHYEVGRGPVARNKRLSAARQPRFRTKNVMFGNICSPNCSPLVRCHFILTDFSSHILCDTWNHELLLLSDSGQEDKGLILDEAL